MERKTLLKRSFAANKDKPLNVKDQERFKHLKGKVAKKEKLSA
jgi:hypothetical protein